MSTDEAHRLATLEQTLVRAATRQMERRRVRRRRAVLLVALAAPLVLAAAASMAAGGLFSGGVDQQLSTLRDDRLIARSEPSLSAVLGARPRDRASRRAWLIPGHRVTGYTTPGGSFCFRFAGLTGGCLPAGKLTAAEPIDASTDYGPRAFRIYGLAMDGVAAISLQARGVTRRVLMGRNAFYFEDNSLGGTRGFAGALVVRMRDGSTRHVPFRVGPPAPPLLLPTTLPGFMPVGDTVA